MLGTFLRFPNAAGSETAPVPESNRCPSFLRAALTWEDFTWDGPPHSISRMELTLSSHKATRNLCEVLVRSPRSKWKQPVTIRAIITPHNGYFLFIDCSVCVRNTVRHTLCVTLFNVLFLLFWEFFVFCLSRAAPTAHGGSWARGWIRAVAASLCYSHSSVGSKPGLWPTLQLMATKDP